MSELRTWLRTQTAPLHEAVDAAYASFGFGHRHGYERFLRAHSRVLTGMETALEQAGIARLLDDWPLRIRRHALAADLDELGVQTPQPLQPPTLPDSTSCWGAVYVLEGSRLGGRVLARRLHECDPLAPARYLQHGEVASLWPGFLARLETASPTTWPLILNAARRTFELFIEAAALEQANPAEKAKGPVGPLPDAKSTA